MGGTYVARALLFRSWNKGEEASQHCLQTPEVPIGDVIRHVHLPT